MRLINCLGLNIQFLTNDKALKCGFGRLIPDCNPGLRVTGAIWEEDLVDQGSN